ncbi:MAG: pyridoxal phosphate-dependent aminotransferase [Candidatus Babeliales bacterium]|jgi:aspartate/methionine/tyrosine aminotransferase
MLEIPLSGIKRIEEIAKSSDEYISLSQGSVKLGGIPQQIKDYIQTLMRTDKTDYYESCWGLKTLREKLAAVLSHQYHTSISTEAIIPTHGCIGGLALLYFSILEPGDEVIIPEPTYPAYGILAQASRSVPVYVSMLTMTDTTYDFVLDVEKIKAATTKKTKIIILTNPGNPSGMVIPLSAIRELQAWCEQHSIFLVIDEAYRDYAFTPEYQTALPLVAQSEWIICANTFSKNMAMSGWRIGYLVVPPHITKALAGMQDALLNCLNNTAQYAALFALDHPELTASLHTLVKNNRDLAMELLQPLVAQNLLQINTPEGGLFIFFKTPHINATDLCMSILQQAKVSLVPGQSFGPSGAPFLRLCYARDAEILREGITRLVKFFI